MQNTLWMLFGAALVSLGVLASALADRIRGLRISNDEAFPAIDEEPPRERVRRVPSAPVRAIPVVEATESRTPPKQPRASRTESKVNAPATDGGDDVIAVLIASGYKKPIATEATWACTVGERATVESWTASALRRCARGGMS